MILGYFYGLARTRSHTKNPWGHHRLFSYTYKYTAKQLIVPIKNDVIQYKWPMLGQYTFYHWSITMYASLSLIICIAWRHFYRYYKLLLFLGLLMIESCFDKLYLYSSYSQISLWKHKHFWLAWTFLLFCKNVINVQLFYITLPLPPSFPPVPSQTHLKCLNWLNSNVDIKDRINFDIVIWLGPVCPMFANSQRKKNWQVNQFLSHG